MIGTFPMLTFWQGFMYILYYLYILYLNLVVIVQVTEEVRSTVEARLKEAAEYQSQLEKKLMEAEKEKQEQQDEKHKVIESMDQQV